MEKNSPQGGTELQLSYLYKYVDNKLLDRVQITTSIPEKIPLSKDKPNILWQKNSWDQPNIHPWFKEKTNHDKYDWYVQTSEMTGFIVFNPDPIWDGDIYEVWSDEGGDITAKLSDNWKSEIKKHK